MSEIEKIHKEREATLARLKKLDQDLRSAEEQQFRAVPEQFGLKSMDAFLREAARYASPRLRGKLQEVFQPTANEDGTTTTSRKKRAVVDDSLRKQIIEALKAGNKTSKEIAKAFDVGSSTVNNIKSDEGLTAKRKTGSASKT